MTKYEIIAMMVAALVLFGVALAGAMAARRDQPRTEGYIAAAVQANRADAEWLSAKAPSCWRAAESMLEYLNEADEVLPPQTKLDGCAQIARVVLARDYQLTDTTRHRLRQIVGRADRIH